MTPPNTTKILRVALIAVLRIHLILDPHWKKMDPDPGHFFQIY